MKQKQSREVKRVDQTSPLSTLVLVRAGDVLLLLPYPYNTSGIPPWPWRSTDSTAPHQLAHTPGVIWFRLRKKRGGGGATARETERGKRGCLSSTPKNKQGYVPLTVLN